jgi:hypothetical protein
VRAFYQYGELTGTHILVLILLFMSIPYSAHRKQTALATMEIKEETRRQQLARQSKNSWISFSGFCKKSDKLAKIRFKKMQLNNQRKSFGVNYMTLLERNASQQELQKCISNAQIGMDIIQEEINALQGEAGRIDEKSRRKMVRNPCSNSDNVDVPSVATSSMMTLEEPEYVAVASPIKPKPSAPLEEIAWL